MRSLATGTYQGQDRCRKLDALSLGPASSNRGLRACSESAPSAARQSSVPYSRFRDRASEEEDADRLEASSCFGRQRLLQRAPAAVSHFSPSAKNRSFAEDTY